MINVALKEWAVICQRLVTGEQAILIRKGGIAEVGGPGRFRLETPRFALYPAWLHQRPDRIKSRWRAEAPIHAVEPAEVTIQGIGNVDFIWQVPSRAALDPLDDLHAWESSQLDLRWNYKPHQPLYLLAVRVHRLAIPRRLVNNPRYAGCKSWIELDAADAIDEQGAQAVLSDAVFTALVARIDAALTSY